MWTIHSISNVYSLNKAADMQSSGLNTLQALHLALHYWGWTNEGKTFSNLFDLQTTPCGVYWNNARDIFVITQTLQSYHCRLGCWQHITPYILFVFSAMQLSTSEKHTKPQTVVVLVLKEWISPLCSISLLYSLYFCNISLSC